MNHPNTFSLQFNFLSSFRAMQQFMKVKLLKRIERVFSCLSDKFQKSRDSLNYCSISSKQLNHWNLYVSTLMNLNINF